MPELNAELQPNSSDIIYSSFDQAAIEEKYHCRIDIERAEQVLSAALSEYTDNELGFFKEKNQAEEEFINFLIKQGETKQFITTFAFLASMITFGSDSQIFYDTLVRKIGQYQTYRWLFVPEEVCKNKLSRKKEKWEKVNGGTTLFPELFITGKTYKEPEANGFFPHDEGALEFNKEWERYIEPHGRQGDAMIGWYHNCCVLHKTYHGNIFEYFNAHNNDAKEIHEALYFKPGGKTINKEFKRFEKKLASLFLQWVGRYELYPLSNLDEFGLPIDLHLCRIAIQTGIINPQVDIPRKVLAYEVFWPIVNHLCKKNRENGWRPAAVSEALWVIGSRGCTPDQNALTPYYTCPLKEKCQGAIKKLDGDDAFYPSLDTIIKKKKINVWGNHKELSYEG